MSAKHVWSEHPVTADIEVAIVDFMLDAIGAADMVASETGGGVLDMTPHTASSAERVARRIRRLESSTCVVEVSHEETFFPGDVNEPPAYHHYIRIEGRRRDGEWTGSVSVHVGDRDMTVAGDDDFVVSFEQRFGRTK